MKQVIALLLTLSLVSVTSCTPYNNYQNTNPSYSINDTVGPEDLLNPQDYDASYLPEGLENVEERNFATTTIKKAIRIILKNPQKAAYVIEKIAGKKTANDFLKGFYRVEPQLKSLLRWSDIPYQALEDAITRGLKNAGIKPHIAAKAGNAVKNAVTWII